MQISKQMFKNKRLFFSLWKYWQALLYERLRSHPKKDCPGNLEKGLKTQISAEDMLFKYLSFEDLVIIAECKTRWKQTKIEQMIKMYLEAESFVYKIYT